MSKSPAWAKQYLGKTLNIENAKKNKWSEDGFLGKKTIGQWGLKLKDLDNEGCPHVWWRYVLIKVNPKNKILTIKTPVYEISCMGKADLMTTDLLPLDQEMADKEIEKIISL